MESSGSSSPTVAVKPVVALEDPEPSPSHHRFYF